MAKDFGDAFLLGLGCGVVVPEEAGGEDGGAGSLVGGEAGGVVVL